VCSSDLLWPEFSTAHLDAAFEYFGQRERRFGKTSGQLAANADA
jgi:undecaprenyl diphosphate synthase